MLPFLKDRLNDYDANLFIDELMDASMLLGTLDAKVRFYKFNEVLLPMFHSKEAIASMYIEGTQTTVSDVFENNLTAKISGDKIYTEYANHLSALRFGEDFLRMDSFSHDFIQEFHALLLKDLNGASNNALKGRYKACDNRIVNSFGKVVFEPPSHTEMKKYMDELIHFLNNRNDGVNPLVKAAIAHAQFESIHPFEDGNGRVGRALVSLYLYKSGLVYRPYFYLSESISQDRIVYYGKLDSSRKFDYNEWIAFFLRKIAAQARRQINYIDVLDNLYEKTRTIVSDSVNSPKFDAIMEILFKQPILTSKALSEHLNVTVGQAKRYLEVLEKKQVLFGSDRRRNKLYYFLELLEAMRLS